MYLSKSKVITVNKDIYTILDKMSYYAYKLWNVSNYEKMNYKELGFDEFPNWKKQRSYLKDNFFYKMLPSQTTQSKKNIIQVNVHPYQRRYLRDMLLRISVLREVCIKILT